MRKLSILVLAYVIVGLALSLLTTPTSVLGMTGSGTGEDPYMICDVDDLQDMNNDLAAFYKLANNIDASETSEWNEGSGFYPIGGSGGGTVSQTQTRYATGDDSYTGTWSGYSGYWSDDPPPFWDKLDESEWGESWVQAESSISYYLGTFSPFTIPETATNIRVIVKCLVTSTDSGESSIRSYLRVNSANYLVGDSQDPPTLPLWVGHSSDTIYDNPETGLPWTVSAVNNDIDSFGFYISDADPYIRISISSISVSYDTEEEGLGPFTGGLDGDGYWISDLYINRPGQDGVGLFGYVGYNGNSLYRINLYQPVVHGNSYVGSLCGFVGENAFFEGCSSVGGAVYGDSNVGGLCGYVHYGGLLNLCFSSSGFVSGTESVGGLVGFMETGGGALDTYSRMDVYGSSYIGGLYGKHSGGGGMTVVNSYSTGLVVGSSYVGGLGGYNDGDVIESFWDVETSEVETSEGGTGKTTTEMKTESTFTDADWDFDYTWFMDEDTNDGYPNLFSSSLSSYTLTVECEEAGDVTDPGVGTFSYTYGTEVDVVAVSLYDSYTFSRWTGDVDTIADVGDSSTTVTMYGDYTIVARFVSEDLLPMPIVPIITPEEDEADPTTLPWYDIINPAATGLEWRVIDFWSLLIIFIAIAMGVGVMIATGSSLLAGITVAIVLSVGVSMSILSLWVVIVYAIFAGSYLLAVKAI